VTKRACDQDIRAHFSDSIENRRAGVAMRVDHICGSANALIVKILDRARTIAWPRHRMGDRQENNAIGLLEQRDRPPESPRGFASTVPCDRYRSPDVGWSVGDECWPTFIEQNLLECARKKTVPTRGRAFPDNDIG